MRGLAIHAPRTLRSWETRLKNRQDEASDLSVLSQLAPQLASTIASIASDIALVIDADGVIRNVAVGASSLTPSPAEWIGKPWTDTVTGETRKKIEQLLQEVGEAGVSRRREVNHPGAAGLDIPVAYTAVRLGENGPVLAVGRDLRAVAAIQQRFTDSQQEMERGYWKLRQAESRYRMLFQVATDAVWVVDALTLAIVEANHAAAQLFKLTPEQMTGQPVAIGLDARSGPAVEELLVSARATGRPAEIRTRLSAGGAMVELSATPFRGDGAMLLLVRARAVEARQTAEVGPGPMAGFVERMHDAVVITDSSGRVLMANPAFLDLCGLASETQVHGSLLADWVGAPGRDVPALLEQARRHGIAAQPSAAIRPARGPSIEVGISVATLADGDQECVGFTIRRLVQRAGSASGSASGSAEVDELAAAIEQLGAQLGRVTLPDLMREASELAEQHLMTSAIERAGGDRGVAAMLLGIGQDDLDQRLRRVARAQAARGGNSPPSSLLN